MTAGIGIVKQTLGKYTINLYVSVRSLILRFQEERLRMKKEDLGNVLATQLVECMANRKYGYKSGTGTQYSHLTDEGKALMLELIDRLVPIAHNIYDTDSKNRAEQLMMDSLKK
jgi:hypothetical protein